jgi:hypothetical protein
MQGENNNNKIILIVAIVAAILVVGVAIVVFGGFMDPIAHEGDQVVVEIGSYPNFVAILDDCLQISNESAGERHFDTRMGRSVRWVDASNITFVDTEGRQEYMIVWTDDDLDEYDFIPTRDQNWFISDVVDNPKGECFVFYDCEDDKVYGIFMGTDTIDCSESHLLYDILDLDKENFPPTYGNF